MFVDSYIGSLQRKFRQASSPANAVQMSAYMKNRFKFFGVKTPERRRIASEFIDENGLPPFKTLDEIIFRIFKLEQRELHHFAIELCEKYKKHWTPETMKLFERMAVTKSWWDSVDSINIFCIRPYFAKFPDEDPYSITQRWIDSENIWLQRLSVVCQLRLTEKTDTALLARNILQLNQSDEFFIQKAIGWALRDFWRTDPDWVVSFAEKNYLKPLSKREALKHT